MGGRNSKRAPIQSKAKSTGEGSSHQSYHAVTEHQSSLPKIEEELPLSPELLPTWLNETKFTEILRQYVPDFERISDFQVLRGAAVGENYASLMARVVTEIELKDKPKQKLSFVLKVPHESDNMRQLLALRNFFAIENAAYTEVLPELEEMYKAAGKEITIAPKGYKISDDGSINGVLLEDLRPKGFKNIDRRECLDMQHTLAVLQKIAVLHAGTATRVAIKGPYSDDIMDGFMGGNAEISFQMFKGMITISLEKFLKNLHLYGDCEKYRPFLENNKGEFMDEMFNQGHYDPNEFNVLCHGDCWSNNILFKHNSKGELEETLFVDFQMPRYYSPCADLFYFIITSVRRNIKLSQFDYFIRYYYDELSENLRLLKYPKALPSLRQILCHFPKYGGMALLSTIITLPIVLLENTKDASMENFMTDSEGGTNFRDALYTNERYVEYVSDILPWLHNRGILELFDNEMTKNSALAPAVQGPEWLTESLLTTTLTSTMKDFGQLKHFTVKSGYAVGENFFSAVFHLDLELVLKDNKNEAMSLVLKVPLPKEENVQAATAMKTFSKEYSMYKEVIPELEAMLRESGIKVQFAQQYFPMPNDVQNKAILIRNLSDFKYKCIDRAQCLDLEHTKAVLAKLALFHAASAQLFASKSKLLELFAENLFNEQNREVVVKTMTSFLGSFCNSLDMIEGSEQYKSKTDAFMANIYDVMHQLFGSNPEEFNVLNHENLWLSNILFQHKESGEIADVRFIDFQMCRIGSPAQDLLNLLLSSVAEDLQLEHFDYFICYYHEQLVANLQLLKYPQPIPTLREIQMQLIKSGLFGLLAVTGALSLVCMDKIDLGKLEKMTPADAGITYQKAVYGNPRYTKQASKVLLWLDNRGALDIDLSSPQPVKKPEYPTWIDETHFSDVVAQIEPNYEKICSIETRNATNTGDNYASQVLKVDVEAELKDHSKKSFHFILKVTNKVEAFDISMWQLFPKEAAMYGEYLPAFESLYRAAGKDVSFGPQYYEFKKDPGCPVILLENLQPLGYYNKDRVEGLDMIHTKAVLRKLALMHAASVKYTQDGGTFKQIFTSSIFNEQARQFFKDMPKTVYKNFIDNVRTIEGSEVYIDKLKVYFDQILERMIDAMKVDPNEFNVLNHGDAWTNNILFKHNESGIILDTYLIDYQICMYGSPAIDLWYFLISSPQLQLKVQLFDDLIGFYHQNLIENLQLLKCTGKFPTLQELHDILDRNSDLALNASSGIASVCLLNATENASMDNFLADTPEAANFRHSLYGNPIYKEHAKVLFKWFHDRGYLDKV